MNAKNARNAMNASKAFSLLILLSFLALPCQAGETLSELGADNKKDKPANYVAPSLYGLREVIIQYPTFLDPRAATECGLNREPLLTVMQRNLQDPNLEVMVLNETHERRSVRADLAYEIYTTRVDQTCVSVVNVSLTDRASIVLPPLREPRALTINYWQKSVLTRSVVDRHQTSVGDTLAAIGRSFLRDLKLAEPATYTAEQKKPQASEEEEANERNQQMMRMIDESVAHRLIDQNTGADIPAIGNTVPKNLDPSGNQ